MFFSRLTQSLVLVRAYSTYIHALVYFTVGIIVYCNYSPHVLHACHYVCLHTLVIYACMYGCMVSLGSFGSSPTIT